MEISKHGNIEVKANFKHSRNVNPFLNFKRLDDLRIIHDTKTNKKKETIELEIVFIRCAEEVDKYLMGYSNML